MKKVRCSRYFKPSSGCFSIAVNENMTHDANKTITITSLNWLVSKQIFGAQTQIWLKIRWRQWIDFAAPFSIKLKQCLLASFWISYRHTCKCSETKHANTKDAKREALSGSSWKCFFFSEKWKCLATSRWWNSPSFHSITRFILLSAVKLKLPREMRPIQNLFHERIV